ncbi:Imm31 family immunity protein [Candidatus Odyssella thessalonicensis]|uniref:Imm31 family immunity protein n=1 Tax=Candidatus Odyssella thessalonicensis TaxID=84647 RepID=UPI000225B512|nr:Imm31 family immunity protein [Candidatus Odyssella thessalonicensis]
MLRSRFDFYEVVRVRSNLPEYVRIDNLLGTVLGMSQDSEGRWAYALEIEDSDEAWMVWEECLISCNEFKNREDFYSNSSLKVVVDPKTGEGQLKR